MVNEKAARKAAGIDLISLSAICFIQCVIETDPTKSWQERIVLFSSVILSTIFVSFFWGKMWLAFLQRTKESDSVLAKIPRRYLIGGPLFLLAVFIFVEGVSYEMKSAPEYKESQATISTNSYVIARFGQISSLEMDDYGSEINYGGSSRYGKFQFVVMGSVRSGRVQVSWRTTGDHFIPTEIDEITGVDDAIPIWALKE